jgi:CBS-domain-containing membrane protein
MVRRVQRMDANHVEAAAWAATRGDFMNAEEIMTREVSTVSESATIGEALQILSSLEVRHLPVTRDGELIGMISDRDMRDAGLTTMADIADIDRIRALRGQPVSEIMRGDVITVDPATPVPDIANLLVEEKIGAVPVVDEHDNTLVGLVSYVDILRAAAEVL